MHIRANRFSATTTDPEYDDMACFQAVSEGGYWFSLSREVRSPLIEIMVSDQLNCKVSDVSALLSGNTLRVSLAAETAERLDGQETYEIELAASPAELEHLHHVLLTIFARAGRYERAAQPVSPTVPCGDR